MTLVDHATPVFNPEILVDLDEEELQDVYERWLLTDFEVADQLAHAIRPWEFWKRLGFTRFTCKTYQFVIVGTDDELAKVLCSGATLRSCIPLSMTDINIPIFKRAIESIKQVGAHFSSIGKLPYLPAGNDLRSGYCLKMSATVYGT